MDNLKKLQAKWEKKLEKEGLGNIEDSQGRLKKWHSRWFMHPSVGKDLPATQEYYRMAEHFLNSHEFDTAKERKIWNHHSSGISARDISKILKMNRAKVGKILKKLENDMLEWAKLERLYDDDF